MPSLTDLLPLDRQRSLTRDYFLRLGVVALASASALALAAIVLLLPTYILLSSRQAAEKAHLAVVESTLSSADEAGLSQRLAALSSDAATLSALEKLPSVTSIINAALDIPRPGVMLTGFGYTPATPALPGTLLISGTSATRDALRAYQLALQNASFAASAEVPVSTYAEDLQIPFTVTVTLAP